MDLRQRFARNVRDRRKQLELSQEQLSFESGLHRTYISGIERGIRNVGIDNVGLIAKALKCEPSMLLEAKPRW